MTVYFIKSQEYVKIGYSSKPMKRVSALQTANPHKLELLTLMPGSSATEKELHSVFSEYHHLNEWYYYEGDLRKFIEVATELFSQYTKQVDVGNPPPNGVYTSWHDIPLDDRARIASMTGAQVMKEYGAKKATAYNWVKYASEYKET